MRGIIAPLHAAVKTLMATLDTDTETLNAYLTVQKMAETNEEEKRLYVFDFICLYQIYTRICFILANKLLKIVVWNDTWMFHLKSCV